MDQYTNVSLVLFYVYRSYKRRAHKCKKKQLLQDMQYCLQILTNMKNHVDPSESREAVEHLINRMSQRGYQIELQPVLKESDYMDSEVVDIMIRLTEEIIRFCRSFLSWRFNTPISLRLFALHNLPRVLLSDDNNDPSDHFLHMEKEEAISCALCYLGLQDKSQLLHR